MRWGSGGDLDVKPEVRNDDEDEDDDDGDEEELN